MKKTLLSFTLGIIAILGACGESNGKADGDDERAQSIGSDVSIGKQVWMAKNLNTETFRNGDPIPQAKSEEEWLEAGENKEPAWCYYNNDPSNGEKYGKLYNWYAVSDTRGLAPDGYHLPNRQEWDELISALGGYKPAHASMKSSHGWEESGNGSNVSAFGGLPGGRRECSEWLYEETGQKAVFLDIGKEAIWWSSTYFGEDAASTCRLSYDDDDVDTRGYGA